MTALHPALQRQRLRRHVERLHALGPRALAELLTEIGADLGVMTAVEQKLERYARIDPDTLRAVGGDRWPPDVFLAVPAGGSIERTPSRKG